MKGTIIAIVAAGLLLLISASEPAYAEAPTPQQMARAELLYGLGSEAFTEERFLEAERAFCEAFSLVDDPVLLHNCARAAEEAGDLESARGRYHELLQRSALPAELRARGGKDLERVILALSEAEEAQSPSHAELQDNPGPATSETDPMEVSQSHPTGEGEWGAAEIAGWSSLAAGLGLGLAGTILWVHAESLRDDVRSAQEAVGVGGVVDSFSRQESLEKEEQANLEDTVGWVAVPVSIAATITGAVLLWPGQGDPSHSSIRVVPLESGFLVGLGARF